MTNKAQILEFYKKVRADFVFSATDLKFDNCSKSKISAQYLQNTPAKPRKHRDMGMGFEYQCSFCTIITIRSSKVSVLDSITGGILNH